MQGGKAGKGDLEDMSSSGKSETVGRERGAFSSFGGHDVTF